MRQARSSPRAARRLHDWGYCGESAADLEVCLRSRRDQLHHMGFRSSVAHSTAAGAHRTRDWRIPADLAQGLIARALRMYSEEPLGVELDATAYAPYSPMTDLGMSLFPWARFRLTNAAARLRTLLEC